MGSVYLPDELERAIERQVAEGRAASPAAFLEEAVMRLVDDACAEEDEIAGVAQAGAADIEAGAFATVATPDDGRLLHGGLFARLRARLAGEEWLPYRLAKSAEQAPCGRRVAAADARAVADGKGTAKPQRGAP